MQLRLTVHLVAAELAREGVRVNSVMPSWVDTAVSLVCRLDQTPTSLTGVIDDAAFLHQSA
jgi:NAD(P)-dependent dehydrogenase (short-subunit alcohol dehydrogenase family)